MDRVTELADLVRPRDGLRVVGGRVVQVVDSTHVLVDLGDKAVTAFGSAPVGADVRLMVGGGVVEVMAQTPAGVVSAFAGASAPAGYLLCDGAAVSRTTYAALFAVLSTTYGTGDGSSTFNLPDLRTRVPVGKNSSGTFATLGAKGGAETVALSMSHLPARNFAVLAAGTLGLVGSPVTPIAQASGSGTAHPNLQPYIVLNFIVKT